MRARSNVYHEGELTVQELAGDRSLAARHGAGIGDGIVPGARPFLEQQRLLVLAAAQAGGEVWASVWFGERGFAQGREDGHELWIDGRRLLPLEVDPVGPLLRPGAAVGVLAIELETRRRLRVNGVVRRHDGSALAVEVREFFGNCPKYIAKRQLRSQLRSDDGQRERPAPTALAEGRRLDAARTATIARTDTMFVGSHHPERGADASHRGGDPGFVQVVDEETLRIPDYSGNGMYQTLGNLHSTGRAGLVFLDFEGRRLLHVTGTTRLHFDTDEASIVTGGTGRSWELRVERWIEGALPDGVDGRLLERSRFNPR